MAGQMGNKTVTQVGLTVVDRDVEQNLLLVKGAVPGPPELGRRGPGGHPLMAAPKAPVLDMSGKKAKDVTLAEAVFAAEVKPHLVHEVVRAESAAARAGHARRQEPRRSSSGGRAKPWRQKGTGRARAGTTRAPQWTGGGVAFAKQPRGFDLKVNRKARKAALPLGALRPRVSSGSLAVVDAGGFDEPSTRSAAAFLSAWGADLPLLVVVQPEEESVVKSFRNLAAGARPRAVRARGRRARLGALGPRHRGRARAGSGGDVQVSLDPRQVLLAPVVSEKSYSLIEDNKYSFRVHEAHKTQIRQAVEELFDVKVVGVNIIKVQPKPKRRGWSQGHQARLEEGDRPAARRRQDRDLRRGRGLMAAPQVQADEPRPPVPLGLDVRGDHEDRAGEEPARAREEQRAAATTTAASRRATRAAATSAATA